MSKSLARVRAALSEAGVAHEILEMSGETRTAPQAAEQAGCALDQIAKSIIFRGTESGAAVLFLTAGGNQVGTAKATAVAGETLERADADFVRKATGFAIGGVSPVGHKTSPHVFVDPRLMTFEVIFAAAGTPRHIFSIAPNVLKTLTKAIEVDFIT